MPSIYTDIVRPADLSALNAQATDQGLILDHWPLFDGCDDLVAVRFVTTVEEKDEAATYRYLGLTPPRR